VVYHTVARFFKTIFSRLQLFLTKIIQYKFSIITIAVVAFIALLPETASANINFGCGGVGIGDAFPDFPCLLGQTMLQLTSVFAFIAGNLLDLVTKLFVFEMSTTLEQGQLFVTPETGEWAGVPVYRAMWFIVRDLANLSFIFILIYASVSMIFNNKFGLDAKKIVPQLVLVAILMNFSLFFVQVATDFSNYIAYQFFTNVEVQVWQNDENEEILIDPETGEPAFVQIGSTESGAATLSDIIMNVTKVTALVASPADLASSQAASRSAELDRQPGFAFGFFASIFVFFAGLVMLAGAFLLFLRFFMILIFMVSAPIAFASSIVEGGKNKDSGKGLFKGWWLPGLTNQLIFAPAYFGLLYLALQFLQTITDAGLGAPKDSTFAYWVQNAFIFIVSAAFLIAAIWYAKRLSIAGSKLAVNNTKRMFAAGVLGGAGLAGRQTIGRLSNRYLNSNQDRLKQRIASGGVSGKIARMQLDAGKRMTKASFDGRLALDRIPGIRMNEISYGNRDSLKKGFGGRRAEKLEKETEKVVDVAQALNEKQRDRYANRLMSQKTGLKGLFQFITHSQDVETGKLEPRPGAKKLLNKYNNIVMGLGGSLEDKLLEGSPGLSKRKTAAAVNRTKNFLARNEPVYGQGAEPDWITKAQEREITKRKHQAEVLIAENEREAATLEREMAERQAEAKKHANRLKDLRKRLERARELGNETEVNRYEGELNDEQQRLAGINNQINTRNSRLNTLKKDTARIQKVKSRRINSARDAYNRDRTQMRYSNGGYINYKLGNAISGSNWERTKTSLKKRKDADEYFNRMKDVVSEGNLNAPEKRTAADAGDSEDSSDGNEN
jgi:hypothetical protein